MNVPTDLHPALRQTLGRLILRLLLGLALCLPLAGMAANPGKTVELYVRSGCPHCEAATAFLTRLAADDPELRLEIRDIRQDPQALARLNERWRQSGTRQPGVPSIWVEGQLLVGFDSPATTGEQIRAILAQRATPAVNEAQSACRIDLSSCPAASEDAFEIPWSGQKISVQEVGLPLFTLLIGLLDGFNPCSMWVLILMLSMLAAIGDRRRMLAVAGTFVLIEGVVYFGFMAAWLNLFLLIGISRPSEILIALLALVAGSLNLKDFFVFGHGPTLSIPTAAKPGIYARMRAILRAERLWPALTGAVLLAVLVQIVELLCTSGFPALYTRILTQYPLDRASYYGYLLLYNLMYMLDDILILGIGVITLSQKRLQEKEGKVLKLVSGLAMLGLGLYLLLPINS